MHAVHCAWRLEPWRRCALHHAVGKRLARVAAVNEHAFHTLQVCFAPVDGYLRAVAVRYIGRGHGDSVRQPLRIHCAMPLDAANLLARIVALRFGAIGVFYPLRVNNQETGRGVAPQFDADLANGFFLRPAPRRSLRPHRARSTWQNTNTL